MLLLAALPLAIQRIGCLRVAWRGSDRRRARGVQRLREEAGQIRDGGDGGEAGRRVRGGVVRVGAQTSTPQRRCRMSVLENR